MFRRASVDIETIRDYAQACARHAEITPIRKTDIRPIGPRRHKEMQIVKYEGTQEIAARLYQTDVVTYKPNGDIVVRIDGWASIATTEFATNVLGVPFDLFDNRMWVTAVLEEGGETKPFPLLSQGENIFRRCRSSDLLLTNPQACKVHKINRQGANNVRQRYRSFRDYVDRMARLRGERSVRVSNEEMKDMFMQGNVLVMPPLLKVEASYVMPKHSLAEFQQLIEDHGVLDKTQDFYRAFLWLVYGVPTHRKWGVTNRDMLFRALDELTFYMHRGEAFEETELFGEAKRDPYAKFFD